MEQKQNHRKLVASICSKSLVATCCFDLFSRMRMGFQMVSAVLQPPQSCWRRLKRLEHQQNHHQHVTIVNNNIIIISTAMPLKTTKLVKGC